MRQIPPTLFVASLLVQFAVKCRGYSPTVRPLGVQVHPSSPITSSPFEHTHTMHNAKNTAVWSSVSVHDGLHQQSTNTVVPSELSVICTNKDAIRINKTKTLSPAAQWHQKRHHEMISKYRSKILPLERDSCSNVLALTLLALANASLLSLSLLSGQLPISKVILLSIFPGSMFSLWTLQILHDCLHGSLFPKQNSYSVFGKQIKRKSLQNNLLFWGSMPSAFGYYLYLKYGHLTHHKSLGDADSASLKTLFDSGKKDFEDGDVLFVAHRMKLKGEVGPRFRLGKKEVVMSISKSGFGLWRDGRPVQNACVFASSFLYERFMLMVNDVVVAITGRNYFFPNKPKQFHDECASYCRCAVILRALLWRIAGWKSMLFLYLSETLWSIPPHPACAMFVTNHGSTKDESGMCTPSSSTYAGKWYSIFTLGTNYHVEHHDFPTIPLHRLGALRKIAPEYYRSGSRDNLFKVMKKAFSEPEFYACMDAGLLG